MNELGVVFRWSMACVMVVGGCGKTEEGSSGNDDFSDADSRPLADLGDAEVRDVCEEFARIYQDVTAYERGICIVESAESGDGASCEAAVEDCIDGLEVIPTSADECTQMLDFTDCDASVEELNECAAEQREIVERISGLRSCADAREDGASVAEWFDDAPACERLFDACPASFEEPDDTDSPDVTVPPPDTPHVIEGTVDGEAVEIRPDGGLEHSTNATGDSWNSSLAFGGATLWLWGEAETAQGLLRMPPSGSEASKWLCLDAVEIERGDETSSWQSDQVSVLSVCGDGVHQPFELTFAVGYPVNGTLHGEAVDWISSGSSCGIGAGCRFEFQAADAPWGTDRWILEVDTSLEPGETKEFTVATLIHPNGVSAVACGSGGSVSWGEDNQFQIVVASLGPLAQCPGTPVDAELSGVY